jgi:predicted metal-dependent enzyme (double-stranded beta helix superfamily)
MKLPQFLESLEDNLHNFVEYSSNLDLSDPELQKHMIFTQSEYTRNLLKRGENNSYDLILICWDTDSESPIHSHLGSECFVRVLSGHLLEKIYKVNSVVLHQQSESILCPGDTTFINDNIGVHRMSCVNKAISLHLYVPSIEFLR